jgi:hypothetical protein
VTTESGSGLAVDTTAWHVFTFRSNGAVNGAVSVDVWLDGDSGTVSLDDVIVGDYLMVGACNKHTGTYPWHGDIAEIVVYASAVAGGERLMVERYLAAKYGLALGQ